MTHSLPEFSLSRGSNASKTLTRELQKKKSQLYGLQIKIGKQVMHTNRPDLDRSNHCQCAEAAVGRVQQRGRYQRGAWHVAH